MLDELASTFASLPVSAQPPAYSSAIIEENCLRKQTVANRRHSLQHLRELYALDPAVPLFRVLGRLWPIDPPARPLLALLGSLARDPLLLATAPAIVDMPEGAEYQRTTMRTTIGTFVGARLNEATIDKAIRNIASSWAQSGHLQGRTFKVRRVVKATPAAIAFALYLANAAGFHGQEILTSGWVKVLDCATSAAMGLALEAKRVGLIDLRAAGDVFELSLDRLDPRTAHAKGVGR
jgi:hypothetical protein